MPQLLKLLRPYSGEDLEWHPVTSAMSKPQYDRPDCCEDVRNKKGSITSFFAKSPPAAKRPAAGPPEGGQEPARKTALAPAAVGAAAIKVEPAAVREEGGQGDGALAAAGVKWEAGQGLEVTKCEVKEEGLLNRELQLEEAG